MNPYDKYQQNSVFTASKGELTLMLYNGAVRFGNIALEAIEKNDVSRAHDNIVKVQNIIEELRITLNRKYPVSESMEKLYEYIYDLLIQANMKKDKKMLLEAIDLIREFRDTWQEAIKRA